jgi:hypothetical protein
MVADSTGVLGGVAVAVGGSVVVPPPPGMGTWVELGLAVEVAEEVGEAGGSEGPIGADVARGVGVAAGSTVKMPPLGATGRRIRTRGCSAPARGPPRTSSASASATITVATGDEVDRIQLPAITARR